MTFLAIIAALALERALEAAHLEHLRRLGWFRVYRDRVLRLVDRLPGGQGPTGVAVVCLVPTLLVWLVIWLASAWSLVLAFFLSVIVLLYCLGPGELLGQLRDYIKARRADGDDQEADRLAARIMEADAPLSAEDDPNRAVTEAALVRANDRIFAVIFWFAVLGPAGAALYRSADQLRRSDVADGAGSEGVSGHATLLEGLLAWLPARLLAIGYALTGSFEEAVADWKAYYDECTEPFFETSESVLSCAGCGALRVSAGGQQSGLAVVRSARALIQRTLVLWLAILAVFTLLGLA